MKRAYGIVATCLAGLLVLSGCATPKIDSGKFARPATVVIDDIPEINSIATIGIVVPNWPFAYFSGAIDSLYVVHGVQPGQPGYDGTDNIVMGVTAGALAGHQAASAQHGNTTHGAIAGGVVGGIVGGIINANAEETQRRAAGFPDLVRKVMPGVSMRDDLVKALRASLEAKGIKVAIASAARRQPPRLRWPARNEKGEPLATVAAVDTPAVDADVLVQISAMALYAAPGPLNNYNAKVGIGLALYNGRTREFIGWQAFPSEEVQLSYVTYNGLVADIDKAAPALHQALLGLVPKVSDAISGDQK